MPAVLCSVSDSDFGVLGCLNLLSSDLLKPPDGIRAWGPGSAEQRSGAVGASDESHGVDGTTQAP